MPVRLFKNVILKLSHKYCIITFLKLDMIITYGAVIFGLWYTRGSVALLETSGDLENNAIEIEKLSVFSG